MSHSCNQADRQASPRISSSNQTSHNLSRGPGQTFHGHCDYTTALAYLFSVAIRRDTSPAQAVFHSAPTETDGSVIRPSRRSGTQSLAWTGLRPASYDIRILIPFRFGSSAAPVIAAIISSKKGRGPSRWRFAFHLASASALELILTAALRWHTSVSSMSRKLHSTTPFFPSFAIP